MSDAVSTSLEGKLPHYSQSLARLTRALALRHSTHPAAEHGLRLRGIEPCAFEQPLTLTLDSAHGEIAIVLDAAEHAALQSIALDSEPKRASALAGMFLADTLARFDTNDGTIPSVKSIALGAHAANVAGVAAQRSRRVRISNREMGRALYQAC